MAPALPAVITPAGVAAIEVTFTPSVKGCHSAVLKITSSDPDEPLVRVTLSGTGVGTGTPDLQYHGFAHDTSGTGHAAYSGTGGGDAAGGGGGSSCRQVGETIGHTSI